MDHPGTPVEIIGTIIYAMIYPFLHQNPNGFVLYNLQHPRLFLTLSHAFLFIMNITCVIFFFFIAEPSKRLESILIASSLATAFFSIHPLSFFATAAWSHNYFAFPFGTLILLYLYKVLNSEKFMKVVPTKHLIGLGISAGLLSAVTFYFASWIFGILFSIIICYQIRNLSWKTILISAGIVVISSTLGFILAILPNLSNVSHFYEFITGLLTHTNSYLIDSPQMPTALRMIVNFTRAYRDLPTLFIYTAVCIILTIIAFFLWHKQPSKKPGPWGITIGLILQAIC